MRHISSDEGTESETPHKKIYLSSPTMHGDELAYVREAIETNWVSTVGANIDAIEERIADLTGRKYAVALSCGTAALHMAVRLAAERLYGMPGRGEGALAGKKVLCSDMTFSASANPIAYEGGEAVFIDTERETWNMDPAALERAFEIYPDARLVMLVHLYGTPARSDEIREICDRHGALIIEDAAEALGATYKGRPVGSLGDYAAVSFNGNKIITGSAGGMLLTDDKADADRVRKWSTQAREKAPWYQHEEIGYNYRMSNIIAGIVRGQIPHISEHIAEKRAIYERYRDGFKDLPVRMNPHGSDSEPNYWLSCMLTDEDAMCREVRSDTEAAYIKESGKTCPTEILEKLADHNAEGRPLWKPMHLQPIYRMNPFVTADGNGRAVSDAYLQGSVRTASDVGADIFNRGLCLPSDNKMTDKEQDTVIGIVRDCFR